MTSDRARWRQFLRRPKKNDPNVVDAEIVDESPVGCAPAPAPTTPAVPNTPPPTRSVVPTTPVVPRVAAPTPDYSANGAPSFDYVRDKIENRANTAAGSVELAGLGGTGPSVESVDEQWKKREEAGRAKLDEIRRSLGRG